MPGRVLAIGDIHGHVDALHRLLHAIRPTPLDLLVFCGDYIDRGPASAAVVETVRQLTACPNTIALRGNHEDFILQAATDPDQFELWMANGGDTTLRSYGIDPASTRPDTWQSRIPGDHWRFFAQTTQHWFETPHFLFVHGGLQPDQHPAHQDPHALMWTRLDEFRGPHRSGKLVVVGHTPQTRRPRLRDDAVLAIDTGMGHPDGRLTAIDLGTGTVYQANDQRARKPYSMLEPSRRARRPARKSRRRRVRPLPVGGYWR